MLSNNKQTAKLAILLALFVTLTGCAATEDSGSGSGSARGQAHMRIGEAIKNIFSLS